MSSTKLGRLISHLRNSVTRLFCSHYQREVDEIFRIAAMDYYYSLRAKRLTETQIKKEMCEYRQQMIAQQQAMIDSLYADDKEVPTANPDERSNLK